MSAAVTSGQTRSTASRIYDRLRKRSQRAIGKKTSHDMTSSPYSGAAPWMTYEHDAYVAGVRDALNAIEDA